ncbi:MAG: hypothetical protein ACLSGK_14455 [Lachnospiraceae bacterium]
MLLQKNSVINLKTEEENADIHIKAKNKDTWNDNPCRKAVRRKSTENKYCKWLAAECDILIIDEPTVGVDIERRNIFMI